MTEAEDQAGDEVFPRPASLAESYLEGIITNGKNDESGLGFAAAVVLLVNERARELLSLLHGRVFEDAEDVASFFEGLSQDEEIRPEDPDQEEHEWKDLPF